MNIHIYTCTYRYIYVAETVQTIASPSSPSGASTRPGSCGGGGAGWGAAPHSPVYIVA